VDRDAGVYDASPSLAAVTARAGSQYRAKSR
jgi:hypothetical protein